MNTAEKRKSPHGMPTRGDEFELFNDSYRDILSHPQLIVNGIDHMITLHKRTHPAGIVHLETVKETKRDYKRSRVDRLTSWNLADTFDGLEDVFIAINPLYRWRGEKGKRTNENVSQINWLWVDIDCDSDSPDWAYSTVMKIETSKIMGNVIPDPTLTVFSGRGVWLMWQIDPISPRNKISMPIWRKLMKQFGEVLRPYGADQKTGDPARLMRLAGSINSKSGQKVSINQHSWQSYDIKELAEKYLPPSRANRKTKKPREEGKTREGATNKPKNLFTLHSQNYTRFHDIERLVTIRNGNLTGYRNEILFIYALYSMYYHGDINAVARSTARLNDSFSEPLDSGEVEGIIRSVENNSDEGKYQHKTATIIRKLDISVEEQKQMKTLISAEEKRERDKLRKREERGGLSQSERQAKNKEKNEAKKQQKIEALRKAIHENPNLSNVKLGKLLGWSEGTVRNIKKLL